MISKFQVPFVKFSKFMLNYSERTQNCWILIKLLNIFVWILKILKICLNLCEKFQRFLSFNKQIFEIFFMFHKYFPSKSINTTIIVNFWAK